MAAPSAGNQQPWEYYRKQDSLGIVACYRKECRMIEYAEIDMSASVEDI